MHPAAGFGKGIFAKYQPEYAAHGIATFPVRLDRDDDGEVVKKPAVRGYLKTGSALSAQWVLKFPHIDALGFACGQPNKLSLLDVDTSDERVLADALDRHGSTPLIVRTASGKFHGYYRHNGEARRIRPMPGLPIDILGGGFSIAPPSRGPTGSYQIIQGTLDDLDRLPVMRNVPPPAPRKAKTVEGEQLVFPDGTRNVGLFAACKGAARDCDTEAAMVAFALAWNREHCMPPDATDIVMRTARSVWKWETRRRERTSQGDLAMRLAREGEHVLALYAVLRANNRPGNTFNVTNELAVAIGWRRQRLAEARKRLLDLGVLTLLRPAYKGAPAVYWWPS